MGFRTLVDESGQLAGPVLQGHVAELLDGGVVTVLVPSARAALEVRRALADVAIALRVDVATPRAWFESLWARHGDGRPIATSSQMRALTWGLLGDDGLLRRSPGMVELVARVAEQPVPEGAEEAPGLSAVQREVLRLASKVCQRAARHGLAVPGRLLAADPSLVSEARRMVAVGFTSLDPLTEALFRALPETGLTLVCAAPPGAAGEAARLVVQELGGCVADAPCGSRPIMRNPWLQTLLDTVFTDAPALNPDGSLVLLEAGGPEAEGELIARALVQLADEGAERVALVTRDPERSWRELSPKLSSRGMAVCGSWSQPASSLRPVRQFLAFARQVSDLMAVEESWGPLETLRQLVDGSDDSAELEGQLQEALSASVEADRSWWPPRAIVDFLMTLPALVPAARVFRLDEQWRSDRSLAPGDVIAELATLGQGSEPFSRCLERIRAADFGAAAEALLPLAAAARNRDQHRALLAVATTAREAEALVDSAALAPVERLDLLGRALEGRSVTRSVERGRFDEEPRCTVELVSPSDAAMLRQGSADALLMVGETAEEAPVPGARFREGTFGQLMEAIGLSSPIPAEATARATAWGAWAVPTGRLVLERSLHDEKANETQLSPMAAELLSAVAEGSPHEVLGEERISENLSAKGMRPEPVVTEEDSRPGQLSPGHARVLVAREDLASDTLDASSLPVVSATAVERYLECPRRWFFEKALRPRELDAAVTPLAKGNLVHRALELSHRRARQEGGDAGAYVGECFDRLVLEGMAGAEEGAGAVPHSLAEERGLAELRQNLQDVAAFESERFRGFVPRHFEAGFGFEGPPVTCGGAHVVGFIDRVDADADGRAIVVDYKNKQDQSVFREYGGPSKPVPLEEWVPRHIQALLYAKVLPQLWPDLEPSGAVYLMTGAHRGLWGIVSPTVAPRVYGPSLTSRREGFLTTENLGGAPFSEVLDRAEEVVAQAVRAMESGDVAPRPCDPRLCDGCPVVGCERRR